MISFISSDQCGDGSLIMHDCHNLCKKVPKRAKDEVLVTFSDFGWLDWSDIANSDCHK